MKKYADLTEAIEDVLLMQDACNGQAVARMFPAVLDAIVKYDPQKGTDAMNQHPLVILMLDKLAQLSGGFVQWSCEASIEDDAGPGFSRAYNWAKDRLADNETKGCTCAIIDFGCPAHG